MADTSDRTVAVAGSMGPSGELLYPLGALTEQDAIAAFAHQAQGLKDGGADVLWVETMSSHEEARAAIAGASTVGLPVVCTMTFDTAGKTMMGVSPESAAQVLPSLAHPPVAIGANCGVGPSDTLLSIRAMRRANPHAVIVCKANCGLPKYKDGKFTFTGTPQLMAEYARIAVDMGVKIIGGCCGSTPEVIKAMSDAIQGYTPQPVDAKRIIATLGKPLHTAPSAEHIEQKTAARKNRRRR